MANIRMMPPNNVATTTTINGRTYTCAAGATIDIPDFDARVLGANGWVNAAGNGIVESTVGTTAQRPARPSPGQTFHDTTLGFIVAFDGRSWRNPATGAVV